MEILKTIFLHYSVIHSIVLHKLYVARIYSLREQPIAHPEVSDSQLWPMPIPALPAVTTPGPAEPPATSRPCRAAHHSLLQKRRTETQGRAERAAPLQHRAGTDSEVTASTARPQSAL